MNNLMFSFGERSARSKNGTVKTSKPIGSPAVRVILSIFIALVFAFIYFYFKLPALNIHSGELYSFIIISLVVYLVSYFVLSGLRRNKLPEVKNDKIRIIIPISLIGFVLLVFIVGSLIGLPIFRAESYSNLIEINNGSFTSEISEISFDQIPMLDENSANNLADRKLGELSDLVSQFTVNDGSEQINYNNRPVRVTYLNYGDVFKWLKNRGDGIPAYMIIDMVTQDVSLVRVDGGIRYSPSEYFGRDLMRHLRFSYPTFMFDNVNFEIDENGTPFWIASVVEKKIGLFSGRDVCGAVLVNAVTGESNYYDIDSVPVWVDRVYSAQLVLEQYDYHGYLINGFWNSIFGQSECTAATSGYNYIAKEDDVWLYTGITSVSGDRGNIGFILVNQRTKESRYYSCAGAEEFSAMSSAEGAVQQFKYQSTFPLLLNIHDQPTYFMALKDSAGLVKMYAMVNVQQYQIVTTGKSVEECLLNYDSVLIENGIISPEDTDNKADDMEQAEAVSVSGNVQEIRSATIDGNTAIYIKLEAYEEYFRILVKDYPEAILVNVGDIVSLKYFENDSLIKDGTDVSIDFSFRNQKD